MLRRNSLGEKITKSRSGDTEHASEALSTYPVDMTSLLTLPHLTLDSASKPLQAHLTECHPIHTAHYALCEWNQFLLTKDKSHREAFLMHAGWFIDHKVHVGDNASAWPVSFAHQSFPPRGFYLSALAQGFALSVLLRASQLTHKDVFLETAQQAVRTFQLDILDGGISTPIGKDGIFFEEVGAYPATHRLIGFIFALFGLCDYVKLTGDTKINALLCQSHTTMHDVLHEFDVGFWTCSDLGERRLSSRAELALHISLLKALARYAGCNHCLRLASRWKSYQQRLGSQLHYVVTSRCDYFGRTLRNRVRALFFWKQCGRSANMSTEPKPFRVCVPITAFPVTGGMQTVLSKITHITKGAWQFEYVTQHVGPHTGGLVIHRFGMRRMTASQFPAVFLYTLTGFCKLVSLLCYGQGYDLILPQDGIYTAAFGGLAAKLAGVRCVCIDHGNMILLKSRAFRAERVKAITTYERNSAHRLLARLLFLFYCPSLSLLAQFAAHFVDHYFVPGVVGDGFEEVCQDLGVHTSRITRFTNMVEVERHIILDALSKAQMREKHGIASDAIVMAIVCRLAPEKGLEIALQAIRLALSMVSPDIGKRIRVIIAGDGPLRQQVEDDIRVFELDQVCVLWGEASSEEVISLLGLSDIFLFTSWRAAGYPMAVLEAMASGCAVIAATDSMANREALAEGRGVLVAAGDAEGTAQAIVRFAGNPGLCRQMGSLARNYVATQHSAEALKRALLRVTHWWPTYGYGEKEKSNNE